jgi:hypothetical protein
VTSSESRVESSRVESSRVESSRVESSESRVESSRVESSRVERARYITKTRYKHNQETSSQIKNQEKRIQIDIIRVIVSYPFIHACNAMQYNTVQ